jgi:RNA polymerase sigma factor (sigma-70 family)
LSEACDQPRSDRITARRENDRNGAGRLLCRNGAGRARRHDYIRSQTNQFGRQIRELAVLPFRPSVLDSNIFAINVTKLAQILNQCVDEMSLQSGRRSAKKADSFTALLRALMRLSIEHREVIDLVYYHEKSVDEVAQILDVPPATVKTRMFYARKKLAELVNGAEKVRC